MGKKKEVGERTLNVTIPRQPVPFFDTDILDVLLESGCLVPCKASL